MRSRSEKLHIDFTTARESYLKDNSSLGLTVVADTIVPTTPRREVEAVPVNTPVQQVRQEPLQEETGRTHLQEERQQPTNATHQGGEARREAAVADSTANRVPARVIIESHVQPVSAPTSTATISIGSPSTTRAAVDSAATDRLLARPVPVRVIAPLQVDTVAAIDTVNLAENKNVELAKNTISYNNQKEGIAMPVKLDNSDGIFALLVFCFLTLAYVYRGGFSFLKDNMMLVFSVSKSDKLETQTTTKEMFYSYFLVFLAVLLISISLYEVLDRLIPFPNTAKHPFGTIGVFVIFISFFICLKMLFNRFVGYIFDSSKKMASLNQTYIVLLSMFGLLCFFPTLLLIYSNLGHNIIIGFVLILFLIVQLILFIRLVIFFIEQKFNFLYLIAYLCSVEILPYIFLGIGLVYLYKIDIFNSIL